MSNHRPRRLSRDTTERLLRGEGDPAREALAGLLAVAAAPASDGELPGEESALAAFREARFAPVTTPRRTSVLKATLAKVLTAKVAACVIAGTACGGVAVAASTGTLPDPVAGVLGVKKHVPEPPKVPTPAVSTPGLPQLPASPAGSLTKLCERFLTDSGKSAGAGEGDLRTKQFAELMQAVGGHVEQVKPYCLKLVHDVATASPVPTPSIPASGGVPSGGPHSGLPTSLPSLPVPTWRPTLPAHPSPTWHLPGR